MPTSLPPKIQAIDDGTRRVALLDLPNGERLAIDHSEGVLPRIYFQQDGGDGGKSAHPDIAIVVGDYRVPMVVVASSDPRHPPRYVPLSRVVEFVRGVEDACEGETGDLPPAAS